MVAPVLSPRGNLTPSKNVELHMKPTTRSSASRSRRSGRWQVMCTAVLLCMASSCTEPSKDEPSAGTDQRQPVVQTIPSPAGSGGDAALLEARLRERDNGCLVLEAVDGTLRTPLFPRGTEWDDAADALVLPDGATVRVNDLLMVGGSESPFPDESTSGDGPRCFTPAVWQVTAVLGP